MKFILYLLNLLIILSNVKKFEEHSSEESYTGDSSLYNSTNKSEYKQIINNESYSYELSVKGNKSKEICLELDLLLFNWNFLTNLLTSTNRKTRLFYKYYVHLCSDNTRFVQKFKEIIKSQVIIENYYFCDYCEYSFHKFSLIKSSPIIHSYTFKYSDLQNIEYPQNLFTLTLSHLFFTAKHLSKHPYQLITDAAIKPHPKSSVMILLMLLMCGDTGSLIHPGPIRRINADKCGICINTIKTNSRFLLCIQCNNKVHKKCEKSTFTISYLCISCSYK